MSPKGREQQAGFFALAKCCGTAFVKEGSNRSFAAFSMNYCFDRARPKSKSAVSNLTAKSIFPDVTTCLSSCNRLQSLVEDIRQSVPMMGRAKVQLTPRIAGGEPD
jgi:hypothetical protein